MQIHGHRSLVVWKNIANASECNAWECGTEHFLEPSQLLQIRMKEWIECIPNIVTTQFFL